MSVRAFLRSVGVIGAALLSASLLGFIMLGIVARWMTPDENARFQALWGAVMAFGSALSVIEQEASRQAARASLLGQRAPYAVVQLMIAGGLAASAAFLLLISTPSGRAIFMNSLLVVAISFAGVGGFVFQYTFRGVLIGTDDRWRYALVIFLEAALRCAVALTLFVCDVQASYGIASIIIAIGSFGWLPVVRASLRKVEPRAGREPWRHVARKVVLLGGANGASASVLTAFPTLVAFMFGNIRGMGSFFLAVTLTRVPLVLLSPVQAMAVPVATRLVLRGDRRGLFRLQVGILAGVVVVALLGGGVTALVGPFFYGVFFGAQYAISAGLLAILVAATVVIAGALLQAAMLVALERYAQVLMTWLFAAATAIMCLRFGLEDKQASATAAFIGCSLVACGYAAFALQRAVRAVCDD